MRNKAKGVLGRMFGSSTPTSSPSSSVRQTPTSRPPVPSVPATYSLDRRKAPPPPTDVTPQTQPIASSSMEHKQGAPSSPIAPAHVRSITNDSLHKPLPPLSPSNENVSLAPALSESSQPARSSGHTREAATAQAPPESPRAPSLSTFSEDMAGIFSGIGQSDPARELGLPPDSLRKKDRSARDTASNSARRFPLELGRSLEQRSEAKPLPYPTTRTSSVPSSSPNPTPSLAAQRSTSSDPSGSTSLQVDNIGGASLVPRRTFSRTSSTSSRRHRNASNHSDQQATLTPAPFGSPVLVDGDSDFGPSINNGDATLRGKSQDHDTVSSATSSARLVSSPRPQSVHSSSFVTIKIAKDGLARSSFIAASPWLEHTPHPEETTPSLTTPSRLTDPPDFCGPPITPNGTGEDDDEKGRRLACEILENDFTNIAADKVAMFIGGP